MATLLSAKQLKEQASLVELLSKLGYEPARKGGRDKMYISMLRDDDNDPSFAVNDETGVWFDHGTGRGGNVIDFGLAYWDRLGFNDVVEKIQQTLSLSGADFIKRLDRMRPVIRVPRYVVYELKEIGTHPAITGYLKARGVIEAAKACLSEVYYFIENSNGERRQFFSAGWLNEKSGWEVRNKFFKGCLGNKAMTFISGHEKRLAVFEGFMDYLSWKTHHPGENHSVVVLNTLALLKQGIARSADYTAIDLYFDRDPSGTRATNDFLKELPYATDRSSVYKGFNDYNDLLKSGMISMSSLNNDRVDRSYGR